MHRAAQRAASQQIDLCPLQLARAGAGENEPAAAALLLDELMHHGEHGGSALYLVHHDDPGFGSTLDELPQPLGPRRQLTLQVGLEQVEPERPGELRPQPSGLAGAAWAEQEEARPGVLEESR